MKTFNRNYTTPEQSKRLLELGVPSCTADFFYPTEKSDMPIIIVDIKVGWNLKYAIPCWSVGRLMEIWKICHGWPWEYATDEALIDIIMSDFETCIKHLDLSKLEK